MLRAAALLPLRAAAARVAACEGAVCRLLSAVRSPLPSPATIYLRSTAGGAGAARDRSESRGFRSLRPA